MGPGPRTAKPWTPQLRDELCFLSKAFSLSSHVSSFLSISLPLSFLSTISCVCFIKVSSPPEHDVASPALTLLTQPLFPPFECICYNTLVRFPKREDLVDSVSSQDRVPGAAQPEGFLPFSRTSAPVPIH